MPRGDGTGPMGMGPMTGRAAGYCNGFMTPGYANPVGFAYGFGRGRGFRRMFYATGVPGWARFDYHPNIGFNTDGFDEKTALNNQAGILEKKLEEIKKRLSSLEEDE